MKRKKLITDTAAVFTGALLFGAAVNLFLVPHGIVTGGAAGIATVLHVKASLPVGLMIAAVNVPLFALSLVSGGRRGTARAVIGTAAVSAASDALSWLPPVSDEKLLCAILGGAVMGLGSGILITSGFTTGGSDLAAYLLHRRLRRISIGRLVLVIDVTVITGAALVLQNFEGIMYSVICVISYSSAFDTVHRASFRARSVFVVSKLHGEIAQAVGRLLGRGVTLLSGKGWYSGESIGVLLCVVTRGEEYALCEIIKNTDPAAFIIIGEASGVIGEGFRDSAEA